MLIALDVAFRSLGWVAIDKGVIQGWGTLHTAKTTKKKVKVSDDFADNCSTLSTDLITIINKYKPKGLLGELPSGSQSAISAKLLGGAVGVVTAIAAGYKLPLEWISEGDSKKAALDRRSSTKEENIAWARATFPQCDLGTVKCKAEHVADALMAYNGLKNGLLVRTFG
jgi:Holliday junction resolvasome RuvABC endonuclease subunit